MKEQKVYPTPLICYYEELLPRLREITAICHANGITETCFMCKTGEKEGEPLVSYSIADSSLLSKDTVMFWIEMLCRQERGAGL